MKLGIMSKGTLLLCLCSLVLSQNCTEISVPVQDARIVVYVHWGEMGIPKKKVELRETGETKETNERGLAEFAVVPGKYTVRVYNINRGGPSYLYYDFAVEVKANTIVDVVDCLPCV
jgi:hypothetical protein